MSRATTRTGCSSAGLRRLLLSPLLGLLLVPAAAAATLSRQEADIVRAEVQYLTSSFERGDPEPLIQKSHPSLARMAGGQEVFALGVRRAVEQLRASGVQFLSVELGRPGATYDAGQEELCFVPRTTVFDVQGQRMRSTTFMVAVRTRGSDQWSYLEGAGLRRRPEMLQSLFPELEPGVVLPPNTVETI